MIMPRQQSRSPEKHPVALLGFELRRIRVEAGYATVEALAHALGYERSTLSKIEAGDRTPSDPVFNAILDKCQVHGTEREMLVRQLMVIRQSGGGLVPDWALPWLEREAAADFLRLFAPVLVPGLLQVEEYALQVFLEVGMDEDEAAGHVAIRMARKAILDGPEAKRVTALVDESVLSRRVGSAEIMAKQLTHLIEMSRRRNILIQVVRSTGYYGGLETWFEIASGHAIPDTLVQVGIEDSTSDDRDIVDRATATFESIRGRALPAEESRTLMMEALKLWQGQCHSQQ
jgi:transcriptional regulator with XRE-family HTH domain